VNVLAPGTVRTPRTEHIWAGDPEHSPRLERSSAVGRLATPDDVARSFVALATLLTHVTASVAARPGKAPAERLLVLLAVLLREESRECDLFGRSSSCRIQGLLPEQEPSGGARYADRIRSGFERRLGPGLPLA
jgi:hypothetical protein